MNGVVTFLGSVRFSPPGNEWQFLWSSDKSFPSFGGLGFTFYMNPEKERRASIGIIKENPDLLEGLSIYAVATLLKDFLQEHLKDIGGSSLFGRHGMDCSVLDIISKAQISLLESKLKNYLADKARKSIFMMPISGVPCAIQRIEGDIMWVPGDYDLHQLIKEFPITQGHITNSQFPPFSAWDWRKSPLGRKDSLFVCKAINLNQAESIFLQLTGALFCILDRGETKLITGRQMIDGRLSFQPDGSYAFHGKRCLVPPIALPFKFNQAYSLLFWNLCAESSNNRTKTCLEYIGEAWGKSPIASFIHHSIAIDALFGVNRNVKRSILDGVSKHCLSISNAVQRYELIWKLRNSILHGEYATLELSPCYLKYFDEFNEDPTDDQIKIIRECLFNIAVR